MIMMINTPQEVVDPVEDKELRNVYGVNYLDSMININREQRRM